jgi:phenylacetate-CoA oxygenase PaaH subunit
VLDARAPEESAASGPSAVAEAGSAGGRERAPGQGAIYEVFRQERKGQPFQHAGSVVAPDERFAEIYAREQYGRRQESVALWLVPREAVSEVAGFPDEFEMKYRRVDGYSIKARLREAREKAGTIASAPGAGEG